MFVRVLLYSKVKILISIWGFLHFRFIIVITIIIILSLLMFSCTAYTIGSELLESHLGFLVFAGATY